MGKFIQTKDWFNPVHVLDKFCIADSVANPHPGQAHDFGKGSEDEEIVILGQEFQIVNTRKLPVSLINHYQGISTL